MLPLLLPATALLPMQPPHFVRTVACTLELHGSLNTRQRGAKGPETRSETFQVAIHGWLEEVESASGAVSFTWTAAQDPRFPPVGMLNHRVESRGPRATEEVQFYGARIRSAGPFRFTAALRGQNLYPSGQIEFEGQASVADGHGLHDEARVIRFVPFPEIRKGPGDFAAPTLRFGTSSLWRLQRMEAPFMVKGSVTYRNSADGGSFAGRVEATFKLDPRMRK